MDLFFEIIWILVMTRLLFKHLWVGITTREVKKVEKMRFNARGHAVSLLSWIIIGKTNLECVFFLFLWFLENVKQQAWLLFWGMFTSGLSKGYIFFKKYRQIFPKSNDFILLTFSLNFSNVLICFKIMIQIAE